MGVERLGQSRRRLRAGITQLLFAAVGLGAGIAVAQIHLTDPGVPTTRATEMLFAIGFGVLGVASVIFSLLFLVVQWAASTFTPRLTLFRDDPTVWRTFAFVIGVFVFCLGAALSLGRRETTSVIIPAIAIVLALAALVFIRNVHAKAFDAIQLAPSLTAITNRGQRILRTLHDAPGRSTPVELPPRRFTVRWPGGVCVLQQVNLKKALKVATAGDATIVLRQQVGATLRTGVSVADVHDRVAPGPPEPAGLSAKAVLAVLRVGEQRTFGQDPMLAFRVLADIALRALSPAVNDPATAVQTLDHIHQLLSEVLGDPQYTGELADRHGTVRLRLALPSWAEYLSVGVGDIVAAANSQMVLRRLYALLIDLTASADAAHREELRPWLAQVESRLPRPGA